MGFRQDAYAKVWKVEDKGNYSVGQVSVSKKNKNTNQYEVDFSDGFVRFVGQAHEDIKDVQIPEKGYSIQIKSCDVSTNYVREQNKTYVNYVIFSFESQDNKSSSTKASKKSEDAAPTQDEPEGFAAVEDDDLPF